MMHIQEYMKICNQRGGCDLIIIIVKTKADLKVAYQALKWIVRYDKYERFRSFQKWFRGQIWIIWSAGKYILMET